MSSTLGDDVLLFYRMHATEQLAQPFNYQLEVLSDDSEIALSDVLGKDMTVTMEMPNGEKRFFHGLVSQFSQIGEVAGRTLYLATLRPWLWFLTRTSDCRIFQEKTVPDIIKEVFRDKGFTDFDESLSGTYRIWDYCVQYRETDFNFVSRLMEQEGIYYYFKHEDGKHVLVISDGYSSHEPIPGCEEIPYYPPNERIVREENYIYGWRLRQELQPCVYALNDFDFKRPKASLEAKSTAERTHALAEFELYDYPGEYVDGNDGSQYASRRLEELQARYEIVSGECNVRGLAVGGLFEMTGYPREDQNREYLVVSTSQQLQSDQYWSTPSPQGGPVYRCSFSAMESKQPYRAPRTTPKPLVQGPQTAIVVGKSGEEIWTDEHGRVKVQFHWDRYGTSDENSSCWIRVAQIWAGNSWGSIHIPRIGHEVIVDFLEGDPDRPIITGRVYNGTNKPPYELPGNQTQSGLKSRSSKGGSGDNFNEIRMEDMKGSEELYIHAEKDEKIVVENNKTESSGNDSTESVGHDETITIGNDRTETVKANETLTVVKDRTRSVNGNETVTVAMARTHTVGINEAITVGAAQEVTVGAARALTVGAQQDTNIGVNHNENIGKNHSVDVGDSRTVKVGKDDALNVGKTLVVEAGDEITIKTGQASISMKKDGTISIEGKDITINGSGAINIKASKDLVLKGKSILEN